MAKQTRQEHYDLCVAQKLPLPELIKAGPGVASTDVNTTDYREVDDKGNPVAGEAGCWKRAEG
jgi:hypothetical protein